MVDKITQDKENILDQYCIMNKLSNFLDSQELEYEITSDAQGCMFVQLTKTAKLNHISLIQFMQYIERKIGVSEINFIGWHISPKNKILDLKFELNYKEDY